METFTEAKDFVDSPDFLKQRQASLVAFRNVTIDAPIVDIVESINNLPCCFTLQCCYGHFLQAGQQDPNNFERLQSADSSAEVTYRLAYIAFCIENSPQGKRLYKDLSNIPVVDPDFIQFGSGEWFWHRHLNSYALQVEPERFMDKDQATIDYQEALRVQDARDNFYSELRTMLQSKAGNY